MLSYISNDVHTVSNITHQKEEKKVSLRKHSIGAVRAVIRERKRQTDRSRMALRYQQTPGAGPK
jgi:hypothetical protein